MKKLWFIGDMIIALIIASTIACFGSCDQPEPETITETVYVQPERGEFFGWTLTCVDENLKVIPNMLSLMGDDEESLQAVQWQTFGFNETITWTCILHDPSKDVLLSQLWRPQNGKNFYLALCLFYDLK